MRRRAKSLALLAEAVREDNAEEMEQARATNKAALKAVGAPQKRSP